MFKPPGYDIIEEGISNDTIPYGILKMWPLTSSINQLGKCWKCKFWCPLTKLAETVGPSTLKMVLGHSDAD